MAGWGVMVVARERASPVSLAFGFVTLTATIWLLGFAAVYSASSLPVAQWWIDVVQFGVVLIPSAIIIFTLAILQQPRRVRIWSWATLALSALFFMGVVLTDQFVTGVHRHFWGYYPSYGPLSVPFLVFFLASMMLSLYLFWNGSRRSSSELPQRERLHAFSVAFAVAYLGSVDFLPTYGVAFYPFGYVPVFLFIVLSERAIRRFRLIDITPAFAVNYILAIMADALLVLDRDGVVRVANPAARELLGRSETDLLGARIATINDRFLPPEQTDALIHTGEIANYEISLPTEARGTRTFSVSASVMRDQEGEAAAIVCIARDITRRKRAEEEIRQLNAELEQRVVERTRQLEDAVRELEAFSYSVSHDLRAPLRSIAGFSQVLLDDYADQLNGEGQDALRRVYAAAQRMGELIDALLTLSRVTRSDLHREFVDLSALARAIAAELQARDHERRVDFVIQPGLIANGDRQLLRVVLENLLDNAWKFTSQRADVRIEVGASLRSDTQVFFVRDNGAGFDMANIDRVFLPFHRLHDSAEFPGTGIGLATVRRIIHRHGGQVWAESSEGEGTTFYFRL